MDALAKLGIDGWGILLYLVNFGILFYLMNRFVIKPLLLFLTERQNRIKEDVEKASEIREALKKERADEAKARKDRLQDLDDRIKEVKTVARDEAKRLINEAESQRDAILTNAAQTADATIAATIEQSQDEILKRVQKVVAHVLQEGVPENVVRESVEKSWKTVTKA